MRVAVCISGQMRSMQKNFQNINDNLITPNNADVFIHSWYDDELLEMESVDMTRQNLTMPPRAPDIAIKLYKPKRYLFEKPLRFLKPKYDIPEKFVQHSAQFQKDPSIACDASKVKEHIIRQNHSMFYSIMKCNEQKEVYASENNIHYDMVVRIRFDFVFHQPLILQNFSTNALHYMDLCQPDNIISDWINFGGNDIMNVYSSTYLFLDILNHYRIIPKSIRLPNTVYLSETCSHGNEHMIRDLCMFMKIPTRKVPHFGTLRYD